MKRTFLALALTLALCLPTAVQPPVVAADPCIGDTLAWVVTIVGAPEIVPFLFLCSPFGAAPDTGCPISAVGASVTQDQKNGRVDKFDYRLADPCGNIHVTGSYAFKTGELSERLEGNGRTIKGPWLSPTAPTTSPAGHPPPCSVITIALRGNPTGWAAGAGPQATMPLSA